MNAPLPVLQTRALPASAADMRQHVNLIQEVMRAVMIGPSKENPHGVHYGIVPGTQKPTLLKPGAEVLCATFHIAPSYRLEDLSDSDRIRYRITCVGTHQGTGIVLGEGMGECSSDEEKYRWRKAGSRAEFDHTPENRRRIKFGYNRNERREYEIQQVRTEPADVANTILKMACKRAQVAMTLNVTAASDIFNQDLEDLPDELRQHIVDGDGTDTPAAPREPVRQPQSRSGKSAEQSGTTAASNGPGLASVGHINNIRAKLKQKAEELGHEDEAALLQECLKEHGIETLDGITVEVATKVQAWVKAKQ